MKKIVTFLLIVAASAGAVAQEITLDKIYSGYYRGKGIAGIESMRKTDEYTVLDRSGIIKFSYGSTEKTGQVAEGSFEAYIFSPDESKILLQTESEPIYRHSFLAKYTVRDLKSNESFALNEGKFVQEPTFSPDGTKIAFIDQNNLFIQDLTTRQITQVTTDGEKNAILNGLSDWVYEEEFGHARLYEWSADSKNLLYIKLDERAVREIAIPLYGKSLYPQELRYKYPKAGETNSTAAAYLYNISTRQNKGLDLSKVRNYYLPNVFATKKGSEMILLSSARTQNATDVLKVNTETGAVTRIFTETDPAWIETDNVTLEFLPDNTFLWASERDGHRHLYWYNTEGKLLKQVTKGQWEITDFYGVDGDRRIAYIQTTQGGSINKVVSRVDLRTGTTTPISKMTGNNAAKFSGNFNYYIETSSDAATPFTYTLKDSHGKTIRQLQNNDELLQKLKTDGMVTKEFFTVPNETGEQLNAWIMKPRNFDPRKKYPLLMFQYSGPGSQQVSNSWETGNTLWFNHLVQQGYLVACVDGRGTGFRGAKFKKVTYLNLGKYEIEDQIAAARWFGRQSYIDAGRIGIFGWSFGGYMASLALTRGADVFKTGIAVAPVTNWRYYDSVYTERFLRTPQENPAGYDENSPTTYADQLKGKFLLIHGTADDNVHFQNSMEFAEELVQHKKQFEFMAYPDKDHGIYSGNTRAQLFQKMTDFLLKNL